jgi:hypothetical protein
LGEDFGIFGAGLAEGEIVVGLIAIIVDEFPELGFGAAEAAQVPGTVDDLVDVLAGQGSGGFVIGVIGGDELFVLSAAFGGEDFGLGIESGFEGVDRRDGLAFGRFGAGRFLRVAAVGFYLAFAGHGIFSCSQS